MSRRQRPVQPTSSSPDDSQKDDDGDGLFTAAAKGLHQEGKSAVAGEDVVNLPANVVAATAYGAVVAAGEVEMADAAQEGLPPPFTMALAVMVTGLRVFLVDQVFFLPHGGFFFWGVGNDMFVSRG